MSVPAWKQDMEKYYPGGAPMVIQVAFEFGYGGAIVELNRRVYFNDSLTFSALIREALQLVCLSHCKNQYCAVMHARGVICEGLSLDEVKRLVEFHELPSRVPDRTRWEQTLGRVATVFREPEISSNLYDSLRVYHTDQEVDDIGGVVAFAALHRFLLEFYTDRIRIEEEPILFRTIDCARELIVFMIKSGEEETPACSICALCKSVKTESGWVPIEKAFSNIPQNVRFSHGCCDGCFSRWRQL